LFPREIRALEKNTGKPESSESTIHFTARFLNPDFKGDDQGAGELVLKSLAPSAPLLMEVAQALRRPGLCWPLDYSKGVEIPLSHVEAMLPTSRVFQERARADGFPRLLISLIVQSNILDRASQVIDDGLEGQALERCSTGRSFRQTHPHRSARASIRRSSLGKSIVSPTLQKRSVEAAGTARRALERYRMAHGHPPASLEDLVPALLPSVPTDPLSGKPLCYKQSESSSYLICGTGWDPTDNADSSITALNRYNKNLGSRRLGRAGEVKELRDFEYPFQEPASYMNRLARAGSTGRRRRAFRIGQYDPNTKN
jgi:type II secretory pathway pseudopilin PulG